MKSHAADWTAGFVLAWMAFAIFLWVSLVTSLMFLNHVRQVYPFVACRCDQCGKRFGVRAAIRAIDLAWPKFDSAADELVFFGGWKVTCRHCRAVNGLTKDGKAISQEWMDYWTSLKDRAL